jgi:hypothetical protein
MDAHGHGLSALMERLEMLDNRMASQAVRRGRAGLIENAPPAQVHYLTWPLHDPFCLGK